MNSQEKVDTPTQDARPVRERILAASLEIARTIGVEAMTQARVAAAAGVRQSHLTYYFPTRVDLIKATAIAIRDEMIETTDAALGLDLPETAPPLQILREFCAREVRDAPRARLMLSMLVAAGEEPSVREWIYEFDREVVARWHMIFKTMGMNVDDDAVDFFHATFVGATLLGAQTGTDAALDRASRVVEQAFDLLVQRCH